MALSAFGLDIWSDFLLAQVENGKNGYTQDAMPMGVNIAAEYKFDIGEFGKSLRRTLLLDRHGRKGNKDERRRAQRQCKHNLQCWAKRVCWVKLVYMETI
ncbi:MAG: hypothetical protein ACLUKN_15975 [Bacilli bacterium]